MCEDESPKPWTKGKQEILEALQALGPEFTESLLKELSGGNDHERENAEADPDRG